MDIEIRTPTRVTLGSKDFGPSAVWLDIKIEVKQYGNMHFHIKSHSYFDYDDVDSFVICLKKMK